MPFSKEVTHTSQVGTTRALEEVEEVSDLGELSSGLLLGEMDSVLLEQISLRGSRAGSAKSALGTKGFAGRSFRPGRGPFAQGGVSALSRRLFSFCQYRIYRPVKYYFLTIN